MKQPAAGRALATFAVGFLLLDAVLLIWLGLDMHRSRLVWGGIVCVAAAVAVVFVWRRYRHALAEVDRGRKEMKAEAESLRALLREHHLNN